MKKAIIKAFIVSALLLAVCFSLIACGKGIKRDDAKQAVADFFACVEKDDYEGAVALMHPDWVSSAEGLKGIVERDEADEGIDLSLGVTDIKYTGFESAMYDTEVGGARYELSGHAKAGGVRFEFEIELVKNESGYGISELDLERD